MKMSFVLASALAPAGSAITTPAKATAYSAFSSFKLAQAVGNFFCAVVGLTCMVMPFESAGAATAVSSARVDIGYGGPVVFGGVVETYSLENDIAQSRIITVNNGPGVIIAGTPPPFTTLTRTNAGGTGAGYADLASGKLGVIAASKPGGDVAAFAAYQDTLTFNIAGANENTVTPIRAIISLHASSLDPGQAKVFGFGFGAGNSLWLFDSLAGPIYTDVRGFLRYDTSYFSDANGVTRLFDVTVNAYGANPSLTFGMGLQAQAANGGTSDLSHTGSVKFDLGPNVSFTSASGVFLTAVSTVPEPASWAMLITGFGLTGGVMRRRRTQAVSA